jgi:hypothetical protein
MPESWLVKVKAKFSSFFYSVSSILNLICDNELLLYKYYVGHFLSGIYLRCICPRKWIMSNIIRGIFVILYRPRCARVSLITNVITFSCNKSSENVSKVLIF